MIWLWEILYGKIYEYSLFVVCLFALGILCFSLFVCLLLWVLKTDGRTKVSQLPAMVPAPARGSFFETPRML